MVNMWIEVYMVKSLLQVRIYFCKFLCTRVLLIVKNKSSNYCLWFIFYFISIVFIFSLLIFIINFIFALPISLPATFYIYY